MPSLHKSQKALPNNLKMYKIIWKILDYAMRTWQLRKYYEFLTEYKYYKI